MVKSSATCNPYEALMKDYNEVLHKTYWYCAPVYTSDCSVPGQGEGAPGIDPAPVPPPAGSRCTTGMTWGHGFPVWLCPGDPTHLTGTHNPDDHDYVWSTQAPYCNGYVGAPATGWFFLTIAPGPGTVYFVDPTNGCGGACLR